MDNLLGLSRAEQEYAKVLMSRRLGAHAFTFMLTAASLWLQEPFIYITAACALISEGTAWWFKKAGSDSHARAEEGRRRVLIAQHLGENTNNIEDAKLLASFSKKARQNASDWQDDAYYSASGETGPERLCKALQESAFWSSRLYEAAARKSVTRVALFVIVTVFVVIVLAAIETESLASTAARFATCLLAAMISVDEVGQALTYRNAAYISDRVMHELDHIDPHATGQLINVFANYAIATASSAPIPTRLYNNEHDVIEAAWQDHCAG